MTQPDRIDFASGLNISRLVTGLWQVADIEKEGVDLDPDKASEVLVDYANAGFDTFDMADHYGSAEIISAHAKRKLQITGSDGTTRARFFTKWCPTPGGMTKQKIRAGIQDRMDRLETDCIDLLQMHWWHFDHPDYLNVFDELMEMKREGLISHIGLTNFDTDHLHVLVKEGYEIASNQICMSVLDRRGTEDMTTFCLEHDVKLLTYGTLAGGFLSERWLGKSEPGDTNDWSKMKYQRFINAVGGWAVFQNVLSALQKVGERHNVSIANVATRWVLEQPAVGAIIVGARLHENEHRRDNMALFAFSLDEEDHKTINSAAEQTTRIAGDCGAEYRKPPFLTASGDLSHHLDSLPKVFTAAPDPNRADRVRISSGSDWEDICGFSRAVRNGNRILVSGTTATHGADRVVCKGDVRGQTIYILDKISASLAALGGSLNDVVRTRIYMKDCSLWEQASRVHGRYFDGILPANTLIQADDLVGDYDIEIEAEAELESK